MVNYTYNPIIIFPLMHKKAMNPLVKHMPMPMPELTITLKLQRRSTVQTHCNTWKPDFAFVAVEIRANRVNYN